MFVQVRTLWLSYHITTSRHISTQHESLRPIFHWKQGSCWVPNANKIDTNNMKSTCPVLAPTRGVPTRPIFHYSHRGLCWALEGQDGLAKLHVGSVRLALGQQGVLDTNMLVLPKRNRRVGVLSQYKDSTRVV